MNRLPILLFLCPLLLASAQGLAGSAPGKAELKFGDPAHAALFHRAHACFAGMFDDWRHHPFERGGSFYRASWCRGAGARDDCQIASGTADRRDQHAVRLYTLFYGGRFPQVFGVGFQILKTPVAAGWGVNISYVEGGKSVTGENFNLSFTRFAAESGAGDLTIHVGSGAEYQVARSHIRLPFEDVGRARARLLSGADALQAGALAKLDALERKVLQAIEADEVQTCDYGEYKGDGVPPPCYPRTLNAKEKQAELSRAKAHFSAQKAAWRQEGKRLWALLEQAVPLACLWP